MFGFRFKEKRRKEEREKVLMNLWVTLLMTDWTIMNDQTKPTISSILNEARTTQLTHKMKLIFTKQKISKPINFKYAIATSAILDAICACSFWGTDSVDYFISLFKAFCPLVYHIKKQKRKGKFLFLLFVWTRGLLSCYFV